MKNHFFDIPRSPQFRSNSSISNRPAYAPRVSVRREQGYGANRETPDTGIQSRAHANGVQVYRITPEMKRTRGFFCAIGKCSSCFMVVDGVPNVRTCVTPLAEGMKVETQKDKGRVPMEV